MPPLPSPQPRAPSGSGSIAAPDCSMILPRGISSRVTALGLVWRLGKGGIGGVYRNEIMLGSG